MGCGIEEVVVPNAKHGKNDGTVFLLCQTGDVILQLFVNNKNTFNFLQVKSIFYIICKYPSPHLQRGSSEMVVHLVGTVEKLKEDVHA